MPAKKKRVKKDNIYCVNCSKLIGQDDYLGICQWCGESTCGECESLHADICPENPDRE